MAACRTRQHRGCLVVLNGPVCAGKSTLARRLLTEAGPFFRAKSAAAAAATATAATAASPASAATPPAAAPGAASPQQALCVFHVDFDSLAEAVAAEADAARARERGQEVVAAIRRAFPAQRLCGRSVAAALRALQQLHQLHLPSHGVPRRPSPASANAAAATACGDGDAVKATTAVGEEGGSTGAPQSTAVGGGAGAGGGVSAGAWDSAAWTEARRRAFAFCEGITTDPGLLGRPAASSSAAAAVAAAVAAADASSGGGAMRCQVFPDAFPTTPGHAAPAQAATAAAATAAATAGQSEPTAVKSEPAAAAQSQPATRRAAAAAATPTSPPPSAAASTTTTTTTTTPTAATPAAATTTPFVLLVVDDNMLLRSMRKQYFQLARAHGFGFVQVALRVDLARSLRRNARRPPGRRVPEDVLRATHERNEVPDAARFEWETNSLLVSAASDADADSDGDSDGPDAVARTVLDFVFDHLHAPLTVGGGRTVEDEQARRARAAASRAVTEKSLLARLDAFMRRTVGAMLTGMPGGPLKQKVAKAAVGLKKATLKAFQRHGGNGGNGEDGGNGNGAAESCEARLEQLCLTFEAQLRALAV